MTQTRRAVGRGTSHDGSICIPYEKVSYFYAKSLFQLLFLEA